MPINVPYWTECILTEFQKLMFWLYGKEVFQLCNLLKDKTESMSIHTSEFYLPRSPTITIQPVGIVYIYNFTNSIHSIFHSVSTFPTFLIFISPPPSFHLPWCIFQYSSKMTLNKIHLLLKVQVLLICHQRQYVSDVQYQKLCEPNVQQRLQLYRALIRRVLNECLSVCLIHIAPSLIKQVTLERNAGTANTLNRNSSTAVNSARPWSNIQSPHPRQTEKSVRSNLHFPLPVFPYPRWSPTTSPARPPL